MSKAERQKVRRQIQLLVNELQKLEDRLDALDAKGPKGARKTLPGCLTASGDGVKERLRPDLRVHLAAAEAESSETAPPDPQNETATLDSVT